jgi:hypothetical protein
VVRYISDDAARADQLMSLIQDVVYIHEKKTNHGHLMSFEQRAEMLSTKEETSLEKEAMAVIDTDPEMKETAEFVLSLFTGDAPQILEALVSECNL